MADGEGLSHRLRCIMLRSQCGIIFQTFYLVPLIAGEQLFHEGLVLLAHLGLPVIARPFKPQFDQHPLIEPPLAGPLPASLPVECNFAGVLFLWLVDMAPLPVVFRHLQLEAVRLHGVLPPPLFHVVLMNLGSLPFKVGGGGVVPDVLSREPTQLLLCDHGEVPAPALPALAPHLVKARFQHRRRWAAETGNVLQAFLLLCTIRILHTVGNLVGLVEDDFLVAWVRVQRFDSGQLVLINSGILPVARTLA